MTTRDPGHGLIFVPCTEIGTITTTRYESTAYGPIASIDLGGGVSVHVHTAEAARQGLTAWIDALRILDPAALAEFWQEILSERILELLAEGEGGTCHDGAEHPCGPDCEDEPEQVMYGGFPLDVAQPEDIPVPYYPATLTPLDIVDDRPDRTCSKCGLTDKALVSDIDLLCWNSQNCAARVAGKAGAL